LFFKKCKNFLENAFTKSFHEINYGSILKVYMDYFEVELKYFHKKGETK